MISENTKIFDNVKIGEGSTIEDFSVIGVPVHGDDPVTVIGRESIIRSHTVIYSGTVIGDRFLTGNKANIREYNRIGDDVSIGTLSVIEHHVTIEDSVRIHSQVFVPEFCHISKGAWLGPNVVLTNARYPDTERTKDNLSGVKIGRKARIGANSTILPGVNIGEHSLIGAGSVVVKDTLPFGIYMGNPAVQSGWSCLCGHPLGKNDLSCTECGKRYRVEGSSLIEK